MNDTQKEKIRRFLNDEIMSKTVYDVLLRSFLDSTLSSDVQVLAAQRIAIDLLQDAWKELQKHNIDIERDVKKRSQPGV